MIAKKTVEGTNGDIAKQLFQTFTIVVVIAFLGEVLLRATPSFMEGFKEKRWLEWLLVSIVGVSTYLLWNISTWVKSPKADFEKYRLWYFSTAIKGPMVALVVMLGLTHLNFQVQIPLPATQEVVTSESVEDEQGSEENQIQPTETRTLDFGINFAEASETVLLVVAFLLGFYNRLAKEVLNSFARYIFKDAYKKAYAKEENVRQDTKR